MNAKNVRKVAGLSFRDVVEKELSRFSPRTQDIVKSRFDVHGRGKGQTLEAIGKQYGITRERIRQIIAQVLHDFGSANAREIETAIQTLEDVLRGRGGIVEKNRFYEETAGGDAAERGAIDLLLTYSDKFSDFDRDLRFRPVFIVSDFDEKAFEEIVGAVKSVFESDRTPKTFDEIYGALAKELSKEIDKTHWESYLNASAHVMENPFGHWGLTSWPEVNPRATREKAHLVLKYNGEPLHFRDIALHIDKHGLGRGGRPTNPQTVHNELIKDPVFVLIGRGVYGLSDWGLSGGTTREIITEVLQDAGKPMTRAQICKAVQKRLNVKEGTIVLSLKNHFKKVGTDKYDLR